MQSSCYLPPWISALFVCLGGWFGCFRKPSVKVDERPKIQGCKVKRPSLSDDLWSSSAFEMDGSSVQSPRSISNQPLDPSGSTSHPSEYVNHGLLLWNQTRQQWLGNKRSEKQAQLRKPPINWNAFYDSLHGNNRPFPQPVPLPEMVDFLVYVWEQEGLYD